MLTREEIIRRAVDDFFISVGSLIASQIANENAKLADLFRLSPDSGVASYGRPFVRDAMRKLVNELLGDDKGQPLWIGILLTGRLNSLSHVAKRFIYWDYPSPSGNGLRCAGELWDNLINDETALRMHFREKLSISKWYETGLLEPAVRRVHLLNLDLLPGVPHLGEISSKTTAIGLFGKAVGKMSGMYHGLDDEAKPKFDNYLEFLFGRSTGVALYTAKPIVSEHNVMKRSIGEVFLAEGVSLLSPASRENLLAGLRDVALGLASRFFFIDQEELESEKKRLRKFEERLSLIEKPLRSLTEAIDLVRADAQSISMAVYEPSDGLFKYHRELSQYFIAQTLTISPKLAVNIEHDIPTYGNDVTPIAVLYLVLGRILGFDREIEQCQSKEEVCALSRARVDTIRNTGLEQKRKLDFLSNFIFCYILEDPKGMADLNSEKAKSILGRLKCILHTPFKPDAYHWPIHPLMIACLTEESKEFPATYMYIYKGLESPEKIADIRKAHLEEVEFVQELDPPYALHHILEFIGRLRDSQRDINKKETGASSPITELHIHDRQPDKQGQLVVIEIRFTTRKADPSVYAKAVVEGMSRRIKDGNAYDSNDMIGDTLLPFEHLVRVGAVWKCLRPRLDGEDAALLASCIQAIYMTCPSSVMTKKLEVADVVFCLVPRESTQAQLSNMFVCTCQAHENSVCVGLYMCRTEEGVNNGGGTVRNGVELVAGQKKEFIMRVGLFDHHRNGKIKSNVWSQALQKAFGSENVRILGSSKYSTEEPLKVYFIHGEEADLKHATEYLRKESDRYVVLLGSGCSPAPRSLCEDVTQKGVRWDFCPWSAADFMTQSKEEIKLFVESVRQGKPDFSLFYSATPQILTVSAILAQGDSGKSYN